MSPARSPRWLVTGAGGMLARDLLPRLEAAGIPALGADRRKLDIVDATAVREVFAAYRPAVVVNCAAFTAVDDAEEREEEALAVNGRGPRWLADQCAASGAVLLQISTDYVFDGRADRPYREDAVTGPRGAYGRTKLAGEQAVLETCPEQGYVVRTGWLYGAAGHNFVATMIRAQRQRETLDVVDDQRGQPTWTADLAGQLTALGIAALAGDAPPGIYHGTSAGHTTWYEFAREIFGLLGADPDRIRPISSDRFQSRTPRPAFSVLGHDRWAKAGLAPIRNWRPALAEAFPAVLAAASAG
ncbi:dTDP-4-dehydrorhamnose reductase [Micromonospora sp. DT229]|uniref:dTDP-4-dehydrorhamnose reductase n=1 Tax=Micromonospora sp. DT229 TaxID=3393430 RepID=UPI003CE7970A